jgi:hypothetical protein
LFEILMVLDSTLLARILRAYVCAPVATMRFLSQQC